MRQHVLKTKQVAVQTSCFSSFCRLRKQEALKDGISIPGRDAAHRIHPMAGQGANLGFGDAQGLAEVLVESVYEGSPLGELLANS